MWDLFGAGDGKTRPFGDAVIDGFDLDIEGGGATGYTVRIYVYKYNCYIS